MADVIADKPISTPTYIQTKQVSHLTKQTEENVPIDYMMVYDLPRMKKAVESETISLPKTIKDKKSIHEFLLKKGQELNV
ncbi:MAG: hypothetical protein KGV51_03960 [Moraxellaceae bacterium]|nr:hypothetical protein [Moraxellaceae bacterium]